MREYITLIERAMADKPTLSEAGKKSARPYHTLLVQYEAGDPWQIAFGDYEKSVVKAERKDSYSEIPEKRVRIITTPDAKQATVTAAVEELNSAKKVTEAPDEPEVQWSAFDEPQARPSRTRVRDRDPRRGLDFQNPTSRGDLAATSGIGRAVMGDQPPPGRTASAARTRASIRGGGSPDMARHLAGIHALGMEDEISDEEARNRAGMTDEPLQLGGPRGTALMAPGGVEAPPATPENLPAVISRAMIDPGRGESGGAMMVNPEWHQVKHLPGYLQSAIRSIGRQVFAPFTDTPIEDIQVLSTMTNSPQEVNGMAAWVRENGVRDDSAEIQFDNLAAANPMLQGYTANLQIWNTNGYQFMIVKDPHGNYIYGWPGGRGVHLAGGAPARGIAPPQDITPPARRGLPPPRRR